MTTNTWAGLVQNILARLPKRAVRNIPPKTTSHTSGQLTFQHTNTSMIAYLGDNAVAWIFPGAHIGQIDKKKVHCTFWDVAYQKQNSKGRYLETDTFDTGAEALDFISNFFNFGGAK